MYFTSDYSDSHLQYGDLVQENAMAPQNIQPFSCTICRLSFAQSDDARRHHLLVHRDHNRDDTPSDHELKTPQRRAIACVACARAKTKCDKTIPSCSRCISKNLNCQARCTKRATDAATRIARKQFSLYRRPLPIVPAISRAPSPPSSHSFMTVSTPQPTWSCYPAATWPYTSTSPMMYPYTPPNTSTQANFQSSYTGANLGMPENFDFSFVQPSPASIYSSPAMLETGAVQPPLGSSPRPSFETTQSVSDSESEISMVASIAGFDTTSSHGEPSLSFECSSERSFSVPTPQPSPDFLEQHLPYTDHMGDYGSFS